MDVDSILLWLLAPGGDADHSRYLESAREYVPDVPVHFLDGKNPDVVRCCWQLRISSCL